MAENSSKKALTGEIGRYLLFGVLTTVVAAGSNFGILWGGQFVFGIEGPGADGYRALYSVAKVVSWLCAVLFAFFTNKKLVFRDERKESGDVLRQLGIFASGRLLTLGLDYLLNWLMLLAMEALSLTFLDGLFNISLARYNEMIAWLVAQFAVVVSNYFISKLFVFNKKAAGRGESEQK